MSSVRLDTLKTERAAAGVSVTELARRANSSDATVQRLEVGGVCEKWEAQRIADALEVSFEQLGLAEL